MGCWQSLSASSPHLRHPLLRQRADRLGVLHGLAESGRFTSDDAVVREDLARGLAVPLLVDPLHEHVHGDLRDLVATGFDGRK